MLTFDTRLPYLILFSKPRKENEISVTKLGKILPLWQKFTSLLQIFDSLFLIWKNAELTFANL